VLQRGGEGDPLESQERRAFTTSRGGNQNCKVTYSGLAKEKWTRVGASRKGNNQHHKSKALSKNKATLTKPLRGGERRNNKQETVGREGGGVEGDRGNPRTKKNKKKSRGKDFANKKTVVTKNKKPAAWVRKRKWNYFQKHSSTTSNIPQ